jgi:hypothetical protein
LAALSADAGASSDSTAGEHAPANASEAASSTSENGVDRDDRTVSVVLDIETPFLRWSVDHMAASGHRRLWSGRCIPLVASG